MVSQPPSSSAEPGGLWLHRVSGYAWRLLILGAFAYIVFRVLLRFELVVVAVFIALIIASLLRPAVNVLSRFLPRRLAAVLTALAVLGLIGVVLWLVVQSVTSEWGSLSSEFGGGWSQIEKWLEGRPFHVKPSTLTNLQGKAASYIQAHRSALISQVLNNVGRVTDVATIIALALFCSVFFTSSGDHMWQWFQAQLPSGSRSKWQRSGSVAWHTFAAYTRGIVLVAGTNAVMVGIALAVLRVPLVLPLTILEFTASFIPLIGSPIAMAVATVVALAGRGVTAAVVVLVLIVVFGQIEGHVLQPFVMGWSVRLHPVAVALSVIAGTISAGLLGAVVAVPLVSIAWAVYRDIRSAHDTAEADGDAGGDGNGHDEPARTVPSQLSDRTRPPLQIGRGHAD